MDKIFFSIILGIVAPLSAMVVMTSFSTQPETASPIETPAVQPDVSRSTRLLWGAYMGKSPTDLAALERQVGQTADLQAVFVGWGMEDGSFPTEFGPDFIRSGKTLVIFWEQHGTTLDKIISGEEDPYIAHWALTAKNYQGPIILAPFHEMNGNWDPWDGTLGENTPSKLIAAWKHLHLFFQDNNNVKFAWVINSKSVPDTPDNQLEQYYPGDQYVDIVGVDGFNFNNPWSNFDQIFGDVLSRLQKYNKPIYIFSIASAEGPGKADWITDALHQINNNTAINGFIWFNENKEENWLIDSNPMSLEAFKTALESIY